MTGMLKGKIEILARKTKKIRHFIVRTIAPTVYKAGTNHRLRPMIQFISETFEGGPLTGVEIGVLGGDNAEIILKTLPIRKLFLVDPYIPYVYVDGQLFDPREYLPEAEKKLLKFKEKAILLTKKSSKAVDDIPNNLDFVYIDGNHAYEFVKKDIHLYYPKVRSDGVIGGHDFSAAFPGIVRAVLEFAEEKNLQLHGRETDWWFIKKPVT